MKKIILLLAISVLCVSSGFASAGDDPRTHYHHLTGVMRNVFKQVEETCALENFENYVKQHAVDVGFSPEYEWHLPSLAEVAREKKLFRVAGFFISQDRSLSEQGKQVAHYNNLRAWLSGSCYKNLFVEYVQMHDVDINFVPDAHSMSLLGIALKDGRYDFVEFLLANNAATDVPFIQGGQELWRYALSDVKTSNLLQKYGVHPAQSDLTVCVQRGFDESSLSALGYDATLSMQITPGRAAVLLEKAIVHQYVSESVIQALVKRCLPIHEQQLSELLASLLDPSYQDYRPQAPLVTQILVRSGMRIDDSAALFRACVKNYCRGHNPQQLDVLKTFLFHVPVDVRVVHACFNDETLQLDEPLVEILSHYCKIDNSRLDKAHEG